MTTIFKPTDEIIKVCNIVDAGIENYLKIRSKLEYGTYEHEVVGDIHLLHSIRLLESIIELGRKDLIYIQGALVLSRSIFEGLIRTSWMLLPNDKFIDESRYVAYLTTEIEYLEKIGKEFQNNDLEKSKILEIKSQVSDFKLQLEKLLQDKGYETPRLPNIREMLKELNEERKYLYYIMLSQYSHFSHHSTMIYQENLGTNKILIEKPHIDLWKFCFATTFPVFRFASKLFLASLGSTDEICSDSEIIEFENIVMMK